MLPQHTLHLHQIGVALAAIEAYKYCNLYDPWFKPMDTRGLIWNKICENRKQITMWRQSRNTFIGCWLSFRWYFCNVNNEFLHPQFSASSEGTSTYIAKPCGRRTTETTFQTVLTSESDWHKVCFGQCILLVACLLGTESWNPSSPLVRHYSRLLGIDGKTILKWLLKEWGGRVGIWFISLRFRNRWQTLVKRSLLKLQGIFLTGH
jgi:hypothetical protein